MSGIDDAIERVILKSLAKEPADRYATAGDMVKALQAAIQVVTSPGQAGPVLAAESQADADEKTSLITDDIAETKLASPAPAAETASQSGSSRMILWGVLSVVLVIIIGLALLGVWWFSRPGGPAGPPPPPPPPAGQSPAGPPPAGQPPAGQPPPPPPEAIEACRDASKEDACTVNTPRGTVTGSCQLAQDQLACIPEGGPPGGGP